MRPSHLLEPCRNADNEERQRRLPKTVQSRHETRERVPESVRYPLRPLFYLRGVHVYTSLI